MRLGLLLALAGCADLDGAAPPDPPDAPGSPGVPDDSAAPTTPDEPVPAEPACDHHADCDDGNPCTGEETCDAAGACQPGAAVSCDAGQTCTVVDAEAVCATLCGLPTAPVLAVLRADEALVFAGPDAIETAALPASADPETAAWHARPVVSLSGHTGEVRVLARADDPSCDPGEQFEHVYSIQDAYPAPAGQPGSDAIHREDPTITAWAAGVVTYTQGASVDARWTDPAAALGPAEGTSMAVVALGEGGSLTLRFDDPIADGPGPDLAVFENAFSDTFLELAWVEVSSDGQTFARFDSAAHTPAPIGAFGELRAQDLHGLAGVYRQGFGAPFDLALLRMHDSARSGQLNLDAVTHVRLVDIVGDGSAIDSFGRPIHDPHPTTGSAGFDVDGVAALRR